MNPLDMLKAVVKFGRDKIRKEPVRARVYGLAAVTAVLANYTDLDVDSRNEIAAAVVALVLAVESARRKVEPSEK